MAEFEVLFYRPVTLQDHLVAWWTRKHLAGLRDDIGFHHVSIRIPGTQGVFSSNPPDGVRFYEGENNTLSYKISVERPRDFIAIMYAPYDWRRIWLTDFVDFKLEDRYNFTCAEAVAYVLGININHTPNSLYRHVIGEIMNG